MKGMLKMLLVVGMLAASIAPMVSASSKLDVCFAGSQKMFTEVEAAFEEEHGDVLQVHAFKRIMAEMAAGTIKADLVWGGEHIMYLQMHDQGWLHQYSSPQASSLKPEYQLGEGYFTPANVMYVIMIYNKQLVEIEDAPATWDDLLDPRWKDWIALTDAIQAPPALVGISGLLQVHDYDWSFFETLNENGLLLTASFSEIDDRVAAGEALVGVMPHAGVINQIKAASKKGVESPLAIVWPTQGAIPLIRPIAIVEKEDRSPELTLLAEEFVDFVLSTKGQKIANKYGMITVRNDIPLPSGVPAEFTTISLDQDWIYQHQEEVRREFEKIFY